MEKTKKKKEKRNFFFTKRKNKVKRKLRHVTSVLHFYYHIASNQQLHRPVGVRYSEFSPYYLFVICFSLMKMYVLEVILSGSRSVELQFKMFN